MCEGAGEGARRGAAAPPPRTWILLGPATPFVSSGLDSGSTATTSVPGLRARSTRPTPVTVPPVPTPATKASSSGTCASSSSAVVASCTAGFAAFSNCFG